MTDHLTDWFTDRMTLDYTSYCAKADDAWKLTGRQLIITFIFIIISFNNSFKGSCIKDDTKLWKVSMKGVKSSVIPLNDFMKLVLIYLASSKTRAVPMATGRPTVFVEKCGHNCSESKQTPVQLILCDLHDLTHIHAYIRTYIHTRCLHQRAGLTMTCQKQAVHCCSFGQSDICLLMDLARFSVCVWMWKCVYVCVRVRVCVRGRVLTALTH